MDWLCILSPLTGGGAKNKVVIKRPILASLAAAPVTHGGLGQLVRTRLQLGPLFDPIRAQLDHLHIQFDDRAPFSDQDRACLSSVDGPAAHGTT
ncbi:hypothetical protein TIFTF001_050067 [Ficus carica]|uniref:Uncharacterized protein n=1 Tax=Ficus carica TaxID=3494 RepID=A0AA87YWQ7_FICCA|nr:hypothetical protein TIFTF001_050067 [Ficus carica]